MRSTRHRRRGVRRRGRVADDRRGRGRRRPRDRRPPPGLRVGGLARPRRRRRDARRGARQRRVRRARRVLRARVARPTSTASDAARRSTSGATSALAPRPTRRCALALELERATRAADPRIRNVESATLRRRRGRSRGGELARRRGVDAAHDVLVLGVRDGRRRHRHADRLRLLGRAHASPTSTSTSAPRDAAERAVPAARRQADPGRRTAGRPRSAGHPLGARVAGGALNGESMVKGRSLFVGREGETVAAPGVTLVDDPTLADAFGAATHDGEGVPTRRIELIADGVLRRGPAQRLHRPPGRRGARPGPRVRGGFKSPPGVGVRALHLVPGDARAPRRSWRRSADGLYVQSVSGLHSGTNPVSGDFSVGAGRPHGPRRRARRAGARGHDRVDAAAHAARHRRRSAPTSPGCPAAPPGMTLLVGDMTISGA